MRFLSLVPSLFRYVGAEVVRGRIAFIAAAFAGVASALAALALQRGDAYEGQGVVLLIGLMAISGPFCRSWLDEDVRLGYGALWLQKPVRVVDFYAARLIGLLSWSVLVTLALGGVFVLAVAAEGGPLGEAVISLAALGWIPAMLVVLNFLGSGVGARGSGLFAYGMLFAGFALPGFGEARWLGPLYGVLEFVLPPAFAVVQIQLQLRKGEILAALGVFQPILVYAAACGLLALLTARRIPKRLTNPGGSG